MRISLEAAHIYCIILQICSFENDSPQSPQTPASKEALDDAIRSSGLLPSALDAALTELQVGFIMGLCFIFLFALRLYTPADSKPASTFPL